MPSLPSSSKFWHKHLLCFLGLSQDSQHNSILWSRFYIFIIVVLCTLIVCTLNSLFQYLVFSSRDNGWSDIEQGVLRVIFFVPFDALYALIIYQNVKHKLIFPWYIIFPLVIGEGVASWLLSFHFLPCAYGVACQSKTGAVDPYVASWNLAFNFTPHIWIWMGAEMILSFVTLQCKQRDSNPNNELYIALTGTANRDDNNNEKSKAESLSVEPQNTAAYWFCLWIVLINISIFMIVFTVFCSTQYFCGTSIWNLRFNPSLTSAKIYLVYLCACVVGKYFIKRMARFIDRYCLQINMNNIVDNLLNNKADHNMISAEVLMEMHISIIYNVIFRFLFPVIVSIYEFIVIKIFHIIGDIMHNWIRQTNLYFECSSHFQQKYLAEVHICFVNSLVDGSNMHEWSIRVLLDCSLRFLISCCEGLVVLLLDCFLLPLALQWNLNINADYYTVMSVIIDSVIFISALFVVGNKMLLIKGSDPLFALLTKSYGLYAIYFVSAMAFSVCFFGIPAAMFDDA